MSKKMKSNEIRLGNVIDISEVYRSMKPDILKEARCEKDKNGYRKFVRDVSTHIDMGIPLMWSMILGIVKEEKIPQTSGGHMRIISGYNKEKNEIIYTDSWGSSGNERKTMPFDDAWTVTTGLYSFDPRNRE